MIRDVLMELMQLNHQTWKLNKTKDLMNLEMLKTQIWIDIQEIL